MTRYHLFGLFLMAVSAAIVLAVAWYVLQAFLGLGQYVQTIVP